MNMRRNLLAMALGSIGPIKAALSEQSPAKKQGKSEKNSYQEPVTKSRQQRRWEARKGKR